MICSWVTSREATTCPPSLLLPFVGSITGETAAAGCTFLFTAARLPLLWPFTLEAGAAGRGGSGCLLSSGQGTLSSQKMHSFDPSRERHKCPFFRHVTQNVSAAGASTGVRSSCKPGVAIYRLARDAAANNKTPLPISRRLPGSGVAVSRSGDDSRGTPG
jgi:hypothetical protein